MSRGGIFLPDEIRGTTEHMSDSDTPNDRRHEVGAADPLADFPTEHPPTTPVWERPPVEPEYRSTSASESPRVIAPAARYRWVPALLRPTRHLSGLLALGQPRRGGLRTWYEWMRRVCHARVGITSRIGHATSARWARCGSQAWTWAVATGDLWQGFVLTRCRTLASAIGTTQARPFHRARGVALFLLGVVVGAVLVVGSNGSLPAGPQSAATQEAGLLVGDSGETSRDAEEASAWPTQYRGTLAVDSTPRGAHVFLNGQHVGATPLLLDQLPVGSRAVRVVMSDYRSWSRAIDVVADQRTMVVADLQRTGP